MEFELLLQLKLLEQETGFKIEQDDKKPNLFYITQPNSNEPFAKLDWKYKMHKQTPILKQAHYENVPLYSLDELEALSKKERIQAEQFAKEAKEFMDSMIAKYDTSIIKKEYRYKN